MKPNEPSPEATVIYTDGSCLGNPGPGGWAAIIIPPDAPRVVRVGRQRHATNNQMEMEALIAGLKQADSQRDVVVYTDSQYIANAFNQRWLKKWLKNGWKTAKGPVKNQQLWQAILGLSSGDGRRRFSIKWVRGHGSNQLNNEADELAREQAHAARRAQNS